MKKVFSKELWKKFLASMMIVVSLICLEPKESQASTGDIGGQLAKPVADLLLVIADGAVTLIHIVVKDQHTTLLRFDGGILAYLKTGWNSFVQGVWNVYAGTVNFLSRKVLDLFGGEDIELVPWEPKVKKTVDNYTVTLTEYQEDGFEEVMVLPVYEVTPEEVFGGTIGLFNVNFFYPTLRQSSNSNRTTTSSEETNIAKDLQSVIAAWYQIIKGIAIIGMLSMIVYIGIRILISSSSENKAKYKQLLVDWGVGFCLLFMLHYGMAFGNMFVNSITDAITSVKLGSYTNIQAGGTYTADEIRSVNKNSQYLIVPRSKLEDYIVSGTETDEEVYIAPEGEDQEPIPMEKITVKVNGEDKEALIWKTGLMGRLRVDAAYARDTSEAYFGYVILFLVLVFLLIFFVWTYLKRVLYMAFLTLIAPFVALTYPLDKIKDGQAQAFNFWLKEYMYNLLLQPLHLLLYTILISSAIELSAKNILYSIVALGFLVPAEKLIRQMFGFKGNTPGFVPGAAGAALMMSGISKVLGNPKAPPHGGKDPSSGGGSTSSSLGDNNPNKYGALAESLYGNSGEDTTSEDSNSNTGLNANDYSWNSDKNNDSSGDSNTGWDGSNYSWYSNEDNNTTEDSNTGWNASDYMWDSNENTNTSGNSNTDLSGDSNTGWDINNSDWFTTTPDQNNNGIPDNLNSQQQISQGNSTQADSRSGQQNKTGEKPKSWLAKDWQKGVNQLKDSTKKFNKRNQIMGRAMRRNAGRNIIKGVKKLPKKIGKAGFKTAGGLALSALGGSLALAAGIASGDPKTAFTSATTGSVLGFKAGSNLVGTGLHNANEFFGYDEAKEHAKDAVMTPEERKENKAKEFIKSEGTQRALDKLTSKQRKDLLKAKALKKVKDENGNFVKDENGNDVMEETGRSYFEELAQSAKFSDGGELVATALYGIQNGYTAEQAGNMHNVAKSRGYTKMNELGEERRKDALATLHRHVNNAQKEKDIINMTDGLIKFKKDLDL